MRKMETMEETKAHSINIELDGNSGLDLALDSLESRLPLDLLILMHEAQQLIPKIDRKVRKRDHHQDHH